MVFKVIKYGKPTYLARKLEVMREAGMAERGWDGPTVKVPTYLLDISRARFIYRGAKLFNKLPRTLREEKRTKEGTKDMGTQEFKHQTSVTRIYSNI